MRNQPFVATLPRKLPKDAKKSPSKGSNHTQHFIHKFKACGLATR